MAVSHAVSDVERLAKGRIFIASAVIYLLCMGFMAIGDQLYAGSGYLLYSRLATIPFFLLLLRCYQRLVRVRPPAILQEARQIMSMGRHRAARERFAEVRRLHAELKRLDRARRILQDGLAVTVEQEALLEMGRCSLNLGELERAVDELGSAHAQLPRRADVAIDLAEALARSGQEARAAGLLRQALPDMDAVDRETLSEQPALTRLLEDAVPPRHSSFRNKILFERALLAILLGVAIVHGLHIYVGLF